MNYNYQRRPSRCVRVGNVEIGGDNPIRVQSMTNTSTLDTEGSAQQSKRIADAGGEIVRLTTQGVREAANLRPIRQRMQELGCTVPLVADVHFNHKAAYEAAATADKVRINPGNFVDAARTFRKLEFTDEEYAAEIDRIRDALVPFLRICREHSTAVRLGVNHGSLSDRIMSRYGDTPAGMVESVMEFLRICGEEDFHDIVISVKASNTLVMVQTVRLLVAAMDREGMDYPLHLGVTEAGAGEDGRIKSAVGIGTLLYEGLGDTIRVSLSEAPEAEIPVARALVDYIGAAANAPYIEDSRTGKESGEPSREKAKEQVARHPMHADFPLAWSIEEKIARETSPEPLRFIVVKGDATVPNVPGRVAKAIDSLDPEDARMPVVISIHYDDTDINSLRLKAAADFGTLLMNGYGNAIKVDAPAFNNDMLGRLELDILQAARQRITRTEYISCPSCGRTLFDLQSTLVEVKKATEHLSDRKLKIAVMGCIVNGPGEMADADYGYVGAGPGRVSIYKGKELVVKNIPTAEALPALLKLLENEGI